MRFELYVAARYLKAKRRQAVVGVVTVISIAGVTAGVAALIIALAITNGMRRDLQDKLLGSSAHVQLMQMDGRGISDWQELLARLRQVPHVVAASPGLYEQVLVARGARDGGAMIEGILPDDERTVSDLLSKATPGAVEALEPQPESAPTSSGELPPIVLGSDLADTIGASVGDSVLIISPQGEMTPMGVIPKYVRFRLAGTFHSGFYQYDAQRGFLRLADAQHLFDEPDLLSVISFRVDNLNNAPEIAKAIEQAAGKGYMTTNWTDGRTMNCLRALEVEQVVIYLIVIALIVIVCCAQHSFRAKLDGDGEDARHCGDDEFRRYSRPGAEDFLVAGLAHQHRWDCSGARARVHRFLGRRPLSLHPSVGGRLLHRHTALCAAHDRRCDCVCGFDWDFAIRNVVSIIFGRKSAAR